MNLLEAVILQCKIGITEIFRQRVGIDGGACPPQATRKSAQRRRQRDGCRHQRAYHEPS